MPAALQHQVVGEVGGGLQVGDVGEHPRTLAVGEEPVRVLVACQGVGGAVVEDGRAGAGGRQDVAAVAAAAAGATQVGRARGEGVVRPRPLGHEGAQGGHVVVVGCGAGDENVIIGVAL